MAETRCGIDKNSIFCNNSINLKLFKNTILFFLKKQTLSLTFLSPRGVQALN